MAIILIITAIFMALNMGISGFSVSFAPSYGSGILNRNKAVLFYTISLIAGSCIVGPRVVETLVDKISSAQYTVFSGLIVLISAAATMFLSNVWKVPQSTSLVTVASFVGRGLFYRNVNWGTIGRILAFAAVFSLISFALTVLIKRKFYPPHTSNLRFYEKFFVHREKFKKFIIATDIYSGFGIGTNNVANVVAPLSGALAPAGILWFLVVSPFFGLGAYIGGERVIRSFSREIVPVGEFSAAIISLVTVTFVLAASCLGLPAPYVQFTTFSLLGISCVKDGLKGTAGKPVVRRILWVWVIVPLFAALLSLAMHWGLGKVAAI